MKIGIIGTGNIGRTLALKLASAGHDVKVANSRGPETVDPAALTTGARAVLAADAAKDVDALILSVPPTAFAALAPLVACLPERTAVLDTFNYQPIRDGAIAALDAGQVESLWAAQQLGRPVAKAWNSIVSGSFERKGKPAGTPGRIALPVAADRDVDREAAMALVEDTGFDAYFAGSLADSWRMQPASPCYCTDLTLEELPAALAKAEKDRLPKRRELATEVLKERFGRLIDANSEETDEEFVRLGRALFM